MKSTLGLCTARAACTRARAAWCMARAAARSRRFASARVSISAALAVSAAAPNSGGRQRDLGLERQAHDEFQLIARRLEPGRGLFALGLHRGQIDLGGELVGNDDSALARELRRGARMILRGLDGVVGDGESFLRRLNIQPGAQGLEGGELARAFILQPGIILHLFGARQRSRDPTAGVHRQAQRQLRHVQVAGARMVQARGIEVGGGDAARVELVGEGIERVVAGTRAVGKSEAWQARALRRLGAAAGGRDLFAHGEQLGIVRQRVTHRLFAVEAFGRHLGAEAKHQAQGSGPDNSV